MSIRRALRFWARPGAIIVTALLLCAAAQGQGAATIGVSSYVGQNVASVDIAGQPGVSLDSVQGVLAVEPDKPLTEQQVDESVSALKQRPGVQGVSVDLQPSETACR